LFLPTSFEKTGRQAKRRMADSNEADVTSISNKKTKMSRKEERAGGYAPAGTRLTLRLPDDFHHHCRDGAKTAAVLAFACRRFGRCLMMPNLKPPVTTTKLALDYKKRILDSMPTDGGTTKSFPHFRPLMTLYLTDKTSPEEIREASGAGIVGCKYYPAGATTNSDFGVSDVKNCYPALHEMQIRNMMLCIHSEVTHGDIFEREPLFIEEIMRPLVNDFPRLKITMEHISTKEAVEFVRNETPDTVKATITCHHLLYNRNGYVSFYFLMLVPFSLKRCTNARLHSLPLFLSLSLSLSPDFY